MINIGQKEKTTTTTHLCVSYGCQLQENLSSSVSRVSELIPKCWLTLSKLTDASNWHSTKVSICHAIKYGCIFHVSYRKQRQPCGSKYHYRAHYSKPWFLIKNAQKRRSKARGGHRLQAALNHEACSVYAQPQCQINMIPAVHVFNEHTLNCKIQTYP